METKDVILILLLLILIGIILFSLYHVNDEGVKCFKNPIVYGMKSLPNDTSCYCNGGYVINSNGLFKEKRVG